MQDMGSIFSRQQQQQQEQEQQQHCATKTPTRSESEDTCIVREIVIESDEETGANTVPDQKLPHNYEAILKDADADFHIDNSSIELLYKQLEDGVFLNQKRQKYWVDKESGSNSFMLYAREFSISWGGDNRFWHWYTEPETSDVSVEVAELKDVCWLEINAKFDTTKLTPGTLYQVAFVVKMKNSSRGWDKKVNLRLRLPDGNTKGVEENLMLQPKEEWINIPVDEFLVTPENTGELDISMDEYKDGKWKSGLIIKGVIIQPKKIKEGEDSI
ncbi:hypothetical protein ACOSP7_013019 [Xanthoceras sorbifolium]